MKKTGIVICMLAAFVGLTGCSSMISSGGAKTERQGQMTVNTPDEAWVKESVLDVAASLHELANDKAYINMMSGNDEVAETVSVWSSHTADTSGDIAIVKITDRVVESLMAQTDNSDSLSDIGKEHIERAMCTTFGNYVTSRTGSTYDLAASSILKYERFYAVNSKIENQVMIIPSGDGCAMWIAFSYCGDGIVSVGGSYMTFPEDQTFEEAVDSLLTPWGLEADIHKW